MKARPIHLWVPDFFGIGGIQHYSRMLARGLEELLFPREIRILAKRSGYSVLQPRKSSAKVVSTDSIPPHGRTAAFALLLTQQTIRHRPGLAILTHLHFAPLAFWLKKTWGLRYWVAIHGIEATGPLPPLVRQGLDHADRLLSVSRHTQQLISKQRVDCNRCSILPNCVDPGRFYPEKKPVHLLRLYGLGTNHKILFTLARLDSRERYKGYDLVLEALPPILELAPKTHYVLAGGGDDTARVRRRIHELGLTGKVTLTGFLPENALRDHYNLCDLFVMPSHGEGFGIVFLEALACGRPVIAGNDDGARDPLGDGAFGKLINPRNPAELVDVLAKYLSDSTAVEDFSPRRDEMLALFGFDAFKKRLAGLIAS